MRERDLIDVAVLDMNAQGALQMKLGFGEGATVAKRVPQPAMSAGLAEGIALTHRCLEREPAQVRCFLPPPGCLEEGDRSPGRLPPVTGQPCFRGSRNRRDEIRDLTSIPIGRGGLVLGPADQDTRPAWRKIVGKPSWVEGPGHRVRVAQVMIDDSADRGFPLPFVFVRAFFRVDPEQVVECIPSGHMLDDHVRMDQFVYRLGGSILSESGDTAGREQSEVRAGMSPEQAEHAFGRRAQRLVGTPEQRAHASRRILVGQSVEATAGITQPLDEVVQVMPRAQDGMSRGQVEGERDPVAQAD
jgi:hypothetical protein